MSSSDRYLALMLDGPMQSWGFGSQFERRTTGMTPTKSGVAGMLCAAVGCTKGSAAEYALLEVVRAARMLVISAPRRGTYGRTEDFHTVQNTRRASNTANTDPVVTRREYLVDARFAVILKLPLEWAQNLARAVEDPVWGVWLGRKCCIPAEPVLRGVDETEQEALHRLLGGTDTTAYSRVEDAASFEGGHDTIQDQPISFGRSTSSGSHLREYGMRRVNIEAGKKDSHERPSPASEDSR